ncbi:Uncharacterised protein [Collinsella intestinalis]|nr:Uncharacterised protein [Collinsella intestinalis]
MSLTTGRTASNGSVTHDDPISQRYLVVIMGYEDEAQPAFMGERGEQAAHKLTGARVKLGGRLVEHQIARAHCQHTGECKTLLLTTGESCCYPLVKSVKQ